MKTNSITNYKVLGSGDGKTIRFDCIKEETKNRAKEDEEEEEDDDQEEENRLDLY